MSRPRSPTTPSRGRRLTRHAAILPARRQQPASEDRRIEPRDQRRASARQRCRSGSGRLGFAAAAHLGQQRHRRDDRDLAAARSNTLELVDQIKRMLPRLQAGIPPSIKLITVSDRSLSIRASFSDVQLTLWFTIGLVILVIF